MMQRQLKSPDICISFYILHTGKNYEIQAKLDMTFKELISQMIFANCLQKQPVESYGLFDHIQQKLYKADQLNLTFADICSIENQSKLEFQILSEEEFLQQEIQLYLSLHSQPQPIIEFYEPKFDEKFKIIDIKIQSYDGPKIKEFVIQIEQNEILQTLINRIYETLGLSKKVTELVIYLQNQLIIQGSKLNRTLYQLSLSNGIELIVKIAWTGGFNNYFK